MSVLSKRIKPVRVEDVYDDALATADLFEVQDTKEVCD